MCGDDTGHQINCLVQHNDTTFVNKRVNRNYTQEISVANFDNFL